MSEITTDTAVESVPTSTHDAAAAVVDAFEATDTTGVEVSEPVAEAPAAAPVAEVPEVAAKPLSEAEQLLHAAGFKSAKKPDGRDNYIPHSKVVKIIENGINQGKGAIGQRVQSLETEATTLREQIEHVRRSVSGDPEAFLAELATIDPRYQRYLAPQQAQAAAAPAPDAEMPEPDLPLSDGSRTYSLDGIKKLLEWNTQRVEAKVDARLKPITEREQQAVARAEREAAAAQLRTQSQSQLAEAQTWPQFGAIAPDGNLTPFQAEVLAEMQQDTTAARAAGRRPSMTLRQAYLEVERRHQEPNKVRERILKELQAAPRSTSAPRTPTDTPGILRPASTADMAARTLERLERGQ